MLHSARVGILAALKRRETTGNGGYVDCALVDSTVGTLAFQALNYLVSGEVPKRIGNSHPNLVPYQEFPVADGRVPRGSSTSAASMRCVLACSTIHSLAQGGLWSCSLKLTVRLASARSGSSKP